MTGGYLPISGVLGSICIEESVGTEGVIGTERGGGGPATFGGELLLTRTGVGTPIAFVGFKGIGEF